MAENKRNGRGGRRESGFPTVRKSSYALKEDAVVLREMTERGLEEGKKQTMEWNNVLKI